MQREVEVIIPTPWMVLVVSCWWKISKEVLQGAKTGRQEAEQRSSMLSRAKLFGLALICFGFSLLQHLASCFYALNLLLFTSGRFSSVLRPFKLWIRPSKAPANPLAQCHPALVNRAVSLIAGEKGDGCGRQAGAGRAQPDVSRFDSECRELPLLAARMVSE